MIDLQKPNEWQRRDEETGLLFPWLVESFLDELKTWDLKNKKLFEYGLGSGSVWWSNKCKEYYGVDNNYEWFEAVKKNIKRSNSVAINVRYDKNTYVEYIHFNAPYDIIIIDGIYREECVPVALECLKKGGCLIYDNYMQPSVEVQSEETQQLLLSLPHKIYKQEGHPDWQTLIVYK